MSHSPLTKLGSPPEDGPTFHDMKMNNLQPSPGNRFGFAWLGNQDGQKYSELTSRQDYDPLSVNITSVSEEAESNRTTDIGQEEMMFMPGTSGASNDSLSHLGVPPAPRLSRAFSMPVPSQLGYWQRPSRFSMDSEVPSTTRRGAYSSTSNKPLQELSLELADSVQMAVQTLLQLSPPHLFDPAKEQFSACSVQIPTSSMSALLTSMKNLNYISANMFALGAPCDDGSGCPDVELSAENEFDIGEVLQSVGDSLGGIAAEAEVDLVLHHGDTIKHMGVKGDECGVSYALSHIIFQVLATTRPGDSVEVGLGITEQPLHVGGDDRQSPSGSSMIEEVSPFIGTQDLVLCTFDIVHSFPSSHGGSSCGGEHPSEDPQGEAMGPEDECQPQPHHADVRPHPQFLSTILPRLLKRVGGTLRTSLQPMSPPTGCRYELALTLKRGPSLHEIHQRSPPADDETYRQPFLDVPFACEPSVDELTSFAETLRGQKVAFHASSKGSFAHHLTRYLTSWGMDISHVPTDGVEEKDPAEDTPNAQTQSGYGSLTSSPRVGIPISNVDSVPPINDAASEGLPENKPSSCESGLSLIIIDDDVLVLRRRLLQHRAEAMPNLHLQSRKRPSLASHHRPRSSPSIRNSLLTANAPQQPSPPPGVSSVPIVHFTSLANYKLVKDAIQSLLLTPGSPSLLPEVIVIPKPAGPRRILTALHTAVNKPIVDPFFLPIATSPTGPMSPFTAGRKSTNSLAPSPGIRSGTEPLVRTGSDSASTLPPPSPLPFSEGLEYFSDTSIKHLGGNAASGLIIQSADGRPAGIFFHPQSRTSSRSDIMAMTMMERERVAPRPAGPRSGRRGGPRATGSDSKSIPTEGSNEATLKHGSPSPSTQPWLVVPPSGPMVNTAASPCQDPRCIGDQSDLSKSYEGKGRGILEGCSTTWGEATTNPAKQPLISVAPLESNLNSGVSTDLQSPLSDPTPFSPTRIVNNLGSFASASRPTTSRASPEPKISVARRAAPGTKTPVVSKNVKKKGLGSNIVPPISVLIVEDNAINQTILSTFMRRNKIKYEVAWNGRDAVEKWRNGNFHLILMDIQMPVMDGIEATKEIRRLEKAENIGHFPSSPSESSRRSTEASDSGSSSVSSTPFRSQVIIVALTASSLQSDRVAALAAGCNDFLTKPVTNSWLNDKIMEWGSIKALQMWAELRPEMAKNISKDQVAKAHAVANKLHVPHRSPLRRALLPLPDSQDVGETGQGSYPRTDGSGTRRSFDKGNSSVESSPERWPTSSDEDLTQDPITEPPAVIVTPILSNIELPQLEHGPAEVHSEDATFQTWKEAKLDSELSQTLRPPHIGHRAINAVTSLTSIPAISHDALGIEDGSTEGSTRAWCPMAQAAHEAPPEHHVSRGS